jgi:membrane protein DedA with SNARE-associated domain
MEQLIIDFVYFLKELSYLGIIIALTIEFIPAEVVLPLAGYWVFQGDFNLIYTILAGTVGGTFGPLTLYALGRYGGRPVVEKYGKYFFIRKKEILIADLFFSKYGIWVAFFSRAVPGVRTAISIPCGMAKMNVFLFTIFTFLAMLPLTTLYVYLGFKLGQEWDKVGPLAKSYILPITCAVFVCLTIFIFYKLFIKKSELDV